MNFLSPWFLAASVLVAGPIIAHLIRRVTRDRVVFSSLRFLDPSRPRLQRQRRIQHPLLLAMRCLIVALLAAAFARPFFRGASLPTLSAEPAQDVVILLDESASMRRNGLWNEARDRSVRIAESLRAGDRCSVFAASAGITPLFTADQWAQTPAPERGARLRAILASRSPGWGPLFLDTAIDSALESIGDLPRTTVSSSRLVVISDFASGTRIAGLAGRDWPRGCEVSFERTFPRIENNAGLQFLGWDETAGNIPQARLRIARDQGAPALRLNLQLRDGLTGRDVGASQPLDIASGQTQLVTLPVPHGSAETLEAVLSGDAEDFDNHVWFVPPAPRSSTVAYLGSGDETDPQHAEFYVTRALGSAPGTKLTVVRIDPQGNTDAANAAGLIIVTAPASPRVLDALKKRVENGAFAVVTVGSTDMVDTAAALAGETGWLPAAIPAGPALLGQIDFNHPLFSLFADPRYSDFSHLRFWRPQPIQLPANSSTGVVARFDDGSAAVLESAVARGRVITWGGDWSPAASQWVLSTKFVPWLQSLLERASGGPPRPSYAELSDVARLTRDPDAQWRAVNTADGAFTKTQPTAPGLYQVREYGVTRWVALEVPAEESRTDPLPLDAFEQLGVPVKSHAAAAISSTPQLRVDTAALEIESRQKLWRWLLIAVAALLALESGVAMLLGRRAGVLEPASTGS